MYFIIYLLLGVLLSGYLFRSDRPIWQIIFGVLIWPIVMINSIRVIKNKGGLKKYIEDYNRKKKLTK